MEIRKILRECDIFASLEYPLVLWFINELRISKDVR